LLFAAATDTFFTHAHAKEASQPASVHQQPERGSCLPALRFVADHDMLNVYVQ
jgi:hypothetical protein